MNPYSKIAVAPSEKRKIRREIVRIQERQRRLRKKWLDYDVQIQALKSRLP
jgi:hypothetical protein